MSGTSHDSQPKHLIDAIAEVETIGLASTPLGAADSRETDEHLTAYALPEPGAVFVSRYELERIIGRGGFGAVYAATDRLTRQRVAIKLMQHGPGDELEGIRREATILRLLRLPGAAALLDEGVEGSWPFLVMDFAEGTPFPGEGRDRSWASLREPVMSLLEVLARVHSHGVMHRDLKPGNVLVDASGRATVVDFGLSRATDDLRREQTIAGTPAYIAPEQLAGVSGEPRSDLYAIGTMIFEALTGRLPFDARSVPDLLTVKRTSSPLALATFAPDAPPEVIAAVDALLAPRPADRPRSAAAALAMLRGEPVRDVVSELVASADGVCTREAMMGWFRGPERYLRLRSDAATELWRRTAGDPERVELELRAWLRAGVARLVDGELEVPRPQLERLRAGLRVSAHEVDADADSDSANEVLAWAELAWPAADAATVARASGADTAQVRVAMDRAIDAGVATAVTGDRIAVAARTSVLSVWAPEQRRLAHAALAAALPPGARGRLLHLAQTGSLDDVLAESIATAERGIDDGALDEAVAAVEEGVRLLRLMPGHVEAECMLTLLARVALLQGSEGAANMALYHLEHDAFDTPGLDWVRELVRSMWLLLRGDAERAMAGAHGLGPAIDDELEWWRLSIIGQSCNSLSVEQHELVVTELIRDFIAPRPSLADLAEHLVARIRYRQSRFAECAEAYERSAALRTQPTRRLSALVSAASAWMEVGRFDRAIELARSQRMEAARARHALFEARAEWIERASHYRQAIDLPPDPEIVEAAAHVGSTWLGALLMQNESAFAWRSGECSAAVDWARRAAALASQSSLTGYAHLCTAFAWYLSGVQPSVTDQSLVAVIEQHESPAVAEQIAWLVWKATGDTTWLERAEALQTAQAETSEAVRLEYLECVPAARAITR